MIFHEGSKFIPFFDVVYATYDGDDEIVIGTIWTEPLL